MKTQEEIKKEIEALKTVRPKVVSYSMFGDDNLAQLDAQIDVLAQDLDNSDIYERYDHAGASEEILSAAFHARDWIDNDEDDGLAEGYPLKEGESDDN